MLSRAASRRGLPLLGLLWISIASAKRTSSSRGLAASMRGLSIQPPLQLNLIATMPRGGAAKTSKNNKGNNNKGSNIKNGKDDKSTVEAVRVTKIIKCGSINWFSLLGNASLLFSLVGVFWTVHSIGIPYAEAIWGVLHPRAKMPFFYFPSDQDVRIATNIITQVGEVFPSEYRPSMDATAWLCTSLVVHVLLRFFCPLSLQENLTGKPLDSTSTGKGSASCAERLANGERLALVVERERKTLQSNGTTDIRKKTKLCRLYRVRSNASESTKSNSKKAAVYAFDFFGRSRFYWNPNGGKLQAVP